MEWLDRYFQISVKGSNVKTELLAGLATFLTMAYIIVVNPAILSKGGIDFDSVFVATIAAAFVGTMIMGVCCLLYTSPSPRDRQKSRMPSSA